MARLISPSDSDLPTGPIPFSRFYAFYLHEHMRPCTRAWHVTGTLLFIAAAIAAALLLDIRWCLAGIAAAYAAAWMSHLFLERNTPATFRRPAFSLAADFVMAFELLTGRRRWDERPCRPLHGS